MIIDLFIYFRYFRVRTIRSYIVWFKPSLLINWHWSYFSRFDLFRLLFSKCCIWTAKRLHLSSFGVQEVNRRASIQWSRFVRCEFNSVYIPQITSWHFLSDVIVTKNRKCRRVDIWQHCSWSANLNPWVGGTRVLKYWISLSNHLFDFSYVDCDLF